MENLTLLFNDLLVPFGLFNGYVIVSVFINLIFYLFFKKVLYIKKISDVMTVGCFLLNFIYLGIIYLKSEDLNFAYFRYFNFDSNVILIQLMINFFAICFVLTTYKLIRKKIKYKTSLINVILSLILFTSGLAVCSTTFALNYIFLEFSIILIYLYASNARINKKGIYNPHFIAVSALASVLVVTFLLLTNYNYTPFYMTIFEVGLFASYALKVGYFPVYNYISVSNYKTNIPYSILLYGYLPFLGIVIFNKLSQDVTIGNEVYQFATVIFVVFAMLVYSIQALKTRNLIKYLAYVKSVFTGVCYISILLLYSNMISIKLSYSALLGLLAVYSLLIVLKINFKGDNINFNSVANLFVNNKLYIFALSFSLLTAGTIVPSYITKVFYNMLNQIYLFDKAGTYVVFSILICGIITIFNVFKFIEYSYTYYRNTSIKLLTKKTTLNYVVFLVIICCLFLIPVL